MKIYEIDKKMAFEYITKSLKSSFITITLQNEILDNLENNIKLSEEEMSYLLTAIKFNKELVDSYRNVLIEILEKYNRRSIRMKPSYKILQWGSKRSVVQLEETIYLIDNDYLINLIDNDYLINLDEMGLVK